MAVSHQDQQRITLGHAATGLAYGDNEAFNLLRRQMLTRSNRLVLLPGRRWFETLCRK
jgi:hypothetical protein